MSGLRMIYLGLVVWGAVHPTIWFVVWFRGNGMSFAGLFDALQVNAAASGVFWEVVIASVALSVWCIGETWVRRNWLALVAIPVTFGVGLGCGLPLYLFLRTRPV